MPSGRPLPRALVGGLRGGEHLAARRLDRLADQRGLVELHPFGSGGGKPGEQFAVDRQQVLEARQRAEALRRAVAGLAQQQEGDRADDDRAGREAGGLRLLDLAHQAVARELEAGLGADLGHQVVVVRVEPLRHLERGTVAFAARDREVAREVDGAVFVGEVGEALRDRADGDRGVEHLVVVGERLGDRGVGASEAERREAITRRLAEGGGDRLELGRVDAAGPERLDGALELASAADARVAEDRAGGEGGGAHAVCIPSWRMPWCGRWDGGWIQQAGARENRERGLMPVESVEVKPGALSVEQVAREGGGVVDADLRTGSSDDSRSREQVGRHPFLA